MASLKVGVIGVGVLGRHHARLYGECERAELVGIYDLNPDHAANIAKEFSTTPYATIEELAAGCDALSVAVPTDIHFPVVSDLLKQGKHVLVEKPMAATVEEGAALVELAAEANRVLHVGHVENYNPVITYLDGKIDNPRFIEAHRLASYPPPRPGMRPRGTEVGVVMDLMIHDIDIILHLVNRDVVRVDAVGIPVLSPTEDIANARLTFDGGCVANITASRVSQDVMRKIRVFQSDAYLSLDYGAHEGEVCLLNGMSVSREPVPINKHNALLKELQGFVDAVHEAMSSGKVPKIGVSGERAQKALQIANEILACMAASPATAK